MKTLIALSIAIASLTFQVQAQSDTIEFNASIPTKNLSMDEVHGILMNYLALKCDNWMQVIQLRNISTGQITLYLKLNSAISILPFYKDGPVKRTFKFIIQKGRIELSALYGTQMNNYELVMADFNSVKDNIIQRLSSE
jgi:hypothetical protein